MKVTVPYLLSGNKLTPLNDILSNKNHDEFTRRSIQKNEHQHLYQPYYNPSFYQNLLDANDTLDAAINILVTDTVKSLEVEYKDEKWKENGIDDSEIEKHKEYIVRDLRGKKVTENLKRITYDYYTCGYATVEIIRAGKEVMLQHIPASSMRLVKVSEHDVWQQMQYGQVVYFKPHGADYDVDFRTGRILADAENETKANEVYTIHNYTHYDAVYGKPVYANQTLVSRINQSILNNEVNEEMLRNYNTKPFIVLLSGDYATATMAADDDSLLDKPLADHIQEMIDKNDTSMVLAAPGESLHIEIIQLDKYSTESSSEITKEVNASILTLLQIPEARGLSIQYTSSGSLNSGAEVTILERYAERLKPFALELEDMLNTFYDYRGFVLVLKTFGISASEETDLAKTDKLLKLYEFGILTGYEVRQQYSKDLNLTDPTIAHDTFLQKANGVKENVEEVVEGTVETENNKKGLLHKWFKSGKGEQE